MSTKSLEDCKWIKKLSDSIAEAFALAVLEDEALDMIGFTVMYMATLQSMTTDSDSVQYEDANGELSATLSVTDNIGLLKGIMETLNLNNEDSQVDIEEENDPFKGISKTKH